MWQCRPLKRLLSLFRFSTFPSDRCLKKRRDPTPWTEACNLGFALGTAAT